MRKITFYVEAEVEDIEVQDNASDNEIRAEYDMWMDGTVRTGWYENYDDESEVEDENE
jgi:hypothetical protein